MTVAEWNRLLAPYASPDIRKSVAQLCLVLSLFCFSMGVAFLVRRTHWSLGVPFSVLAGLLLVKIFTIQHDCGHRSFFRNPLLCDWVGRGLSLLTLTPYDYWKADHDKHHASSGNLDRRGYGDIKTLTVAEYKSLPWTRRIAYRAYRHPLVLFGVGPAWQFLVRLRLPIKLGKTRRLRMACSILVHDAALAVFFGMLGLVFGFHEVAALWLPAVLVSATLGVWLFYVQHQFEDTYWDDENWSFVDAALQGASHYRLPSWVAWMTGNIGYHHIHHLSSRVPNYNLPKAFKGIPALRAAKSIGILESVLCVRLSLWCEQRRRLVSFREAWAIS